MVSGCRPEMQCWSAMQPDVMYRMCQRMLSVILYIVDALNSDPVVSKQYTHDFSPPAPIHTQSSLMVRVAVAGRRESQLLLFRLESSRDSVLV